MKVSKSKFVWQLSKIDTYNTIMLVSITLLCTKLSASSSFELSQYHNRIEIHVYICMLALLKYMMYYIVD